jgi:hypothetical protein
VKRIFETLHKGTKTSSTLGARKNNARHHQPNLALDLSFSYQLLAAGISSRQKIQIMQLSVIGEKKTVIGYVMLAEPAGDLLPPFFFSEMIFSSLLVLYCGKNFLEGLRWEEWLAKGFRERQILVCTSMLVRSLSVLATVPLLSRRSYGTSSQKPTTSICSMSSNRMKRRVQLLLQNNIIHNSSLYMHVTN